jgi:hypothetical protein
MVGWVGPRVNLDVVAKRKNPPTRSSNLYLSPILTELLQVHPRLLDAYIDKLLKEDQSIWGYL